jgi:hypothetical protein
MREAVPGEVFTCLQEIYLEMGLSGPMEEELVEREIAVLGVVECTWLLRLQIHFPEPLRQI